MNAPASVSASRPLHVAVDGCAYRVRAIANGLYSVAPADGLYRVVENALAEWSVRRCLEPRLEWRQVSPRALYGLAWRGDVAVRLRLESDTVCVDAALLADALDLLAEDPTCAVVEVAVVPQAAPNPERDGGAAMLLLRAAGVHLIVVQHTATPTIRINLDDACRWLPDDTALDVSRGEKLAGAAW